MKKNTNISKVFIISSLIFGCCLSSIANLAINGDFEDATGWSFGDYAGRVDWAYETGSYGGAFYGWENGSGYFEQHVDCDTNATYYFRIRGLREWNFDNGSVDMRLRFFDNTSNWNSQGEYTNPNVNLSSSTSWTTYEIEADALTGAGIVQIRCDFSGSYDKGTDQQAFKWDNATLYDRRKTYQSTEIVDEFSYDPDYDTGIDGKDRGNGFSQSWTWLWGTIDIDDGSFGAFDGYPKPYGNKLRIASSGSAYRAFTALTNGAIYASACFNYNNEATGNWAGISLMSNAVERVFFGGNSGTETKMKLSIASYGGSTIFSDYTLNGSLGEDYILFCKYDFTTHVFYTKAYYKTFTIPLYEPTDWDTSVDLSGNPDQLVYINGIRLAAGGTNPGDVYFDEVRVGNNWYDLLNNEEPLPFGTMLLFD